MRPVEQQGLGAWVVDLAVVGVVATAGPWLLLVGEGDFVRQVPALLATAVVHPTALLPAAALPARYFGMLTVCAAGSGALLALGVRLLFRERRRVPVHLAPALFAVAGLVTGLLGAAAWLAQADWTQCSSDDCHYDQLPADRLWLALVVTFGLGSMVWSPGFVIVRSQRSRALGRAALVLGTGALGLALNAALIVGLASAGLLDRPPPRSAPPLAEVVVARGFTGCRPRDVPDPGIHRVPDEVGCWRCPPEGALSGVPDDSTLCSAPSRAFGP